MRKIIFYSIMLVFGFWSCEEEIQPKDTNLSPDLVIESYIELSSDALPVYAIVSKSLGFYSSYTTESLAKTFVKGAKVNVVDGSDTTSLQEICLSNLSPEAKREVAAALGINADSITIDICIYVDIFGRIKPQVGKTYQLIVEADAKKVTSKTSIPKLVSLDSIWFDKTPGKALDSFRQMFCIIADNPSERDFYRYFIQQGDNPFRPNLQSVTDDVFFDGQKFKFTLQNVVDDNAEFDETTGYFKLGDTISIKWCNIDQSHYDFWNTLEVSRTRQGPFANYVRIDHNIEGGLGIFGGYHCGYYKVVVK